jgi:hypothetical protein
MDAPARIAVDTNKLNAALGRFPRDRAMIIDGREVKGRGETTSDRVRLMASS